MCVYVHDYQSKGFGTFTSGASALSSNVDFQANALMSTFPVLPCLFFFTRQVT